MADNAQRLFEELANLGYQPQYFECPLKASTGRGVKFCYAIPDGSRTGEMVTIGLVIPDEVGDWPEIAPHWVHIFPLDSVIEEQVKGQNGSVKHYSDQDGTDWMAISAPVSDFWDQIDDPNGKNAKTYIDHHLRRIWGAR